MTYSMKEQNLFNPDRLTLDRILDELTPRIRSNPRVWSSFLLELTAILATRDMERYGLSPGVAVQRAQDVIIVITHHLGGRSIYIPTGDTLVNALKKIVSLRSTHLPTHREVFLKSRTDKENNTWPKILLELFDVLANFYEKRIDLDPGSAANKVKDVILSIARHQGGKAVYMPRNDKIRLAIRDQAIFKAFNGSNHIELSLQSRLTVTRIYSIIHRERRAGQIVNDKGRKEHHAMKEDANDNKSSKKERNPQR